MELKAYLNRFTPWAFLAGSPVLAHAAGEGSGIADNYVILGVVAALLIFAFTRKANKAASNSTSDSAPAATEGEQLVAETSEPDPVASEAIVYETTDAEPVAESQDIDERQPNT